LTIYIIHRASIYVKGYSVHWIETKEGAEKFEVSTRTIYRDIDKLSGAGIPVYTATGYKEGIRLTDGFVLEKSVLPKEDMQNILTGVQSRHAGKRMDVRLPDVLWRRIDGSKPRSLKKRAAEAVPFRTPAF